MIFKRIISKTAAEKKQDDVKRMEFFRAAYPENDTYHGHIVFGKKKEWTDPSGCRHRTVSAVRYDDINHFSDGSFSFQFDGRTDYYMTPNSMCSNHPDRDSVFSFHALVMDLDLHGWDPSAILPEVNDAASRILDLSGFSGSFPQPNAMVFTGRGLQLWWFVEQMSYKMVCAYRMFGQFMKAKVADALKGKFRVRLSPCAMEVDQTSSGNISGYYRVPLTYNTAAGCYGGLLLLHKDRIDVPSFCRAYCPKNDAPRFKKSSPNAPGDYAAYNMARRNALFRLAESRIASGVWGKSGFRNDIIYAMYNCVVHTKGDDGALEDVHAMNRMFPCPMLDKELSSTLCSSRREPYFFSGAYLLEFLGVTDEERKTCGFPSGGGNGRREKKNCFSHVSKEQKETVCRLCADGKTKAGISRETGISASTVGRILGAAGLKTQKEIQLDKARKMILRGASNERIQAKTGMSRSAVYRCRKSLAAETERDRKREEKKLQREREKCARQEEKKKREESARIRTEEQRAAALALYMDGRSLWETARELHTTVRHIASLIFDFLRPKDREKVESEIELELWVRELMGEMKAPEIAEALGVSLNKVHRIYKKFQDDDTRRKQQKRAALRRQMGL